MANIMAIKTTTGSSSECSIIFQLSVILEQIGNYAREERKSSIINVWAVAPNDLGLNSAA